MSSVNPIHGSVHRSPLFAPQKAAVNFHNCLHRSNIQGPFILIWDQSRSHKAKIVQTYLEQHPEIHMEYLPAYAPELNPEVYCHGNVKRRMKNGIFRSKTEIRNSLNKGFSRLRKRPDILLSCFQHAGLKLNQLW